MVGVLLDREPDTLGEWLADAAAFDAAGADALWVDCGPESRWDLLSLAAALAVVTFRSRLVVADADPEGRTLDTIEHLSRGRLVLLGAGDDLSSWVSVPAPQSRESWHTACADAAERGIPGLVVPAGPRLLDLLRNPEDPGERHDLQLAQG
jgi:hypothetical protein